MNSKKEKSSENLKDFIGMKVHCVGFWGRFGMTRFKANPICVLINRLVVFGTTDKKRFSFKITHTWISDYKPFIYKNIANGDQIEFDAVIGPYIKAGNIQDYCLNQVENVVMKNPSCLKNHEIPKILNIDIPYIEHLDNAIVSLKGSGFNTIHASKWEGQTPEGFEFSLKKIRKDGLFIFRWKIKGDPAVRRYAFFDISKGQRMYVFENNKIKKILLPEEVYYNLKDVYFLLTYNMKKGLPYVYHPKVKCICEC